MRKSNITGIEGTPPQISNVQVNVGIDWAFWGFLYLPLKSHVAVSFDVSDNVGLDTVTVRFIRYTGTETREFHFSNTPGSYTASTHVDLRFDFSIFEAIVAGADVNITAYDVNGNGANGGFHIKSVLEVIAAVLLAYLSAIGKLIAAALSALVSFILDMLKALIWPVIRPIVDCIVSWFDGFTDSLSGAFSAEVQASRAVPPPSPQTQVVALAVDPLVGILFPVFIILLLVAKVIGTAWPVFTIFVAAILILAYVALAGAIGYMLVGIQGNPPGADTASALNGPVSASGDANTFFSAGGLPAKSLAQKIIEAFAKPTQVAVTAPATAAKQPLFVSMFKTDAGGLAIATFGILAYAIAQRIQDKVIKSILDAIGAFLAALGMIITITHKDPDDGGPIVTLWWIEELLSIIDFGLSSAGLAFDIAFSGV